MSASDFTDVLTSGFLIDMDNSAVEKLLNNTEQPTESESGSVSQQSSSHTQFQLRKGRYNGETKWIKVPTFSDQPLKYKDFIVAAKAAFELDDSNEVVIRDEDDAIIEPSIFSLFPNTVFRLTPKYLEPTARSGTTGSTAASISTILQNSYATSSTTDGPPPVKKTKFENLDLKEKIRSLPGGKEISTEYEISRGLSAESRRKLVNLVVNLMVTNEGYHPTKDRKIHYAKEIISAFPLLRDPGTHGKKTLEILGIILLDPAIFYS